MKLLEIFKNIIVENVEQVAEEEFGITTSPEEAGYILKDGNMLDFSGKDERGYGGQRAFDHRQISLAYINSKNEIPDKVNDMGSSSRYMVDFMKRGNIRVGLYGNELYLTLMQKPTPAQVRVITKEGKFVESVVIDFIENGRRRSITLNYPTSNDILMFVEGH